MFENRATLVSDALHGSIMLSALEKRLISTRAFNRLHNVLQNSTAYFTFPSNRTSRFSHSLGVAKLAGDMFRHALLNAEAGTRDSFMKDAGRTLARTISSEPFQKDIDTFFSTNRKYSTSSLAQLTSITSLGWLDSSLYEFLVVPGLSERDSYNYAVFAQSLRLVALLHDLGHPPFSHVTEGALTAIAQMLTTQKSHSKGIKKTAASLARYGFEQNDFHELLGNEIAGHLLRKTLEEVSADAERSIICTRHGASKADQAEATVFSMILIVHCTLAILGNRGALMKAVHGIVDGELDADRLDYVQRDLLMCGFSREPFRTERLIQSYVLLRNKARYLFAPSARALSIVEDFFTQRFHVYKYAIYHHRVSKFDALLQKSVEDLATRYVVEEGEIPQVTDEPSNESLSESIDGLWEIFRATAPIEREEQYIQWDDAWLLGLLRREYLHLKKEHSNTGNQRESVLLSRLEELVSNRKKYFVLFKRVECFREVDNAFIEAACKNDDFNVEAFAEAVFGKSPTTSALETEKKECVGELVEYVSKWRSWQEHEHERESPVQSMGYFLSRILRAIQQTMSKQEVARILQQAGNDLKSGHKIIRDVLVVPKGHKGVSPYFELASGDGKAVLLWELSRLSKELEQAFLFAPPFFAYVLAEDGDMIDTGPWAKEFGQKLWLVLDMWIKQRNNHS